MYLSQLDILGFKSFANKTKLKFHEGISCVIGPNGSGKSNIVDAIRWVLGEQKVNTLRSDKMENVIFNGSKHRKPLGFTEVSLSIDNSKNILKSPYSEIVISRRLYRSGESQYLINKSQCRLKDIMDLFMDTGLNANSYSVIELKMVESIISENKNDRRLLFEEAAGITKYKIRRKSALRKLELTHIDLERISDLINEISRNVNSLKRQVGKAKRFLKLQDELKNKEIDLSRFRYTSLLDEIAPLQKQLKELNSIKRDTSHQITIEEALSEEYKRELVEFEQKLMDYNNQLLNIDNHVQNFKKEDAVSQARIESMHETNERFNKELIDSASKIERIKQHSAENIENLKQYQNNISLIENEFANKQNSTKSEIEKNTQVKLEIEELNKLLKEKNFEVSEKREKFRVINFEYDSNNNQLTSLNEVILTNQNELISTKAKNKLLLETKNKLESETDILITIIVDLRKEIKSNQEKNRDLNQQLQIKISKINSLASRISFFEHIISNYEGHSDSIRSILKKKDEFQGLIGPISEYINVDPKYRIAVESALGKAINYLIVKNVNDAKEIIKYCKNEKLGNISLIPLERIEKIKYTGSKIKIDSPALASLIKSKPEFEKIYQILLNDVYLTKDLDEALNFAEKYPDLKFITINGEQVNFNFEITSGMQHDKSESLIGRKENLNALINEKSEIGKEESLIKKNIISVESKIDILQEQLIKSENKADLLKNDLMETEKEFARNDYEIDKKNNEIKHDQERTSQLTELINRNQIELENYKKILDISVSELEKLEKHVIDSANNYEQKNILLQNIQNEIQTIQLRLIEEKNKVDKIKTEMERSEQELTELDSNIKSHEEEITNIIKQIEQEESGKLNRKSKITELWDERDQIDKEKSNFDRSYHELKDKIIRLDDQIKKYRRQHDNSLEKTKQLELKINENEVRAEGIKERIYQEYKEDVSIGIASDNLDINEHEQEVDSLKYKIKQLGQVNPLAVSEYEKEKERFEFYQKQYEDLKNAENSLQDTITKINKTARKQFLDTFNSISENFSGIFNNFFVNGEGTIKLEENVDPLEANVEILVRPKSKRLQTLNLLSGGEKTLTAITLLFAIYLVKPSPFCILDEVDAPLDDVNISRFTKALKDFSRQTQFVVVTHNKRTMEAADSLYGVTMEEEGLSKLVSVKFN